MTWHREMSFKRCSSCWCLVRMLCCALSAKFWNLPLRSSEILQSAARVVGRLGRLSFQNSPGEVGFQPSIGWPWGNSDFLGKSSNPESLHLESVFVRNSMFSATVASPTSIELGPSKVGWLFLSTSPSVQTNWTWDDKEAPVRCLHFLRTPPHPQVL